MFGCDYRTNSAEVGLYCTYTHVVPEVHAVFGSRLSKN